MSTDVWQPLRYGWQHVYWLTIEGIGPVWCERALSKTLPGSHTAESATLVVDGSAQIGAMIDRDTGIGAGYPLTFKLLDSDTLSALLQRPSAQTYLTQDETSSATTLHVADTTAFAASGTVYAGKERIAYTGKTSTTLTGCTRGTAGYAYPQRDRGGAALVTDTPRYWRGRHVTLYAQPIDSAGYAPGTAWTDDSAVIWRGFLASEPAREDDGWSLQALPLDRLLARPLVGELTGEVTDLEPRFQIESDIITVQLWRYTTAPATTYYAINLTPFADAGYSFGDWIGVSEANAAIKAAWAAEVSAQSLTWLGDMVINQAGSAYSKPKGTLNKGDWTPLIEVKQSADTDAIKIDLLWFGQSVERYVSWGAGGTPADLTVALGVNYSWTPYDINSPQQFNGFALPRCTVRFDGGDPGTVPATGALRIGSDVWTYQAILQTPDAAVVQFAGLQPVGGQDSPSISIGSTAHVIIRDVGSLADTARRMLHSSGEAALRSSTYDTLPGIVGYGIPDGMTDDDAIGDVLAEGWLDTVQLEPSMAGQSLADVLGGTLALSQRALVVTDDGAGADAALTAVQTAAAGAGYVVEIGDDDVVTWPDVELEVETPAAPNVITTLLQVDGDTIHTIREVDAARVPAEGVVGIEYVVPSSDKTSLLPAAAGWMLSRIVGDSQSSMVTLDVAPWVAARPGDIVQLDLTHPRLWDWSAGSQGYTGRARCIGRTVSLSDGIQTLRLLLDGYAVGTAISPAAPVVAYDDATTPTRIDLHRDYYPIMSAAMEASKTPTMRLLHYEPGSGTEGVSEYYLISAVTDTGSVCRLSVSSIGGSSVLSSESWLTWPESANDDAWQAQWMHDADGARWV